MHEYSIASSLLHLAEDHARKHDASRVVRLEVRIGELSGIEAPLLETAWSLVRERSLCDGAPLQLKRVEARWTCTSCDADVPPGVRLGCSRCGGRVRLAAGDELVLDRIEMEVG